VLTCALLRHARAPAFLPFKAFSGSYAFVYCHRQTAWRARLNGGKTRDKGRCPSRHTSTLAHAALRQHNYPAGRGAFQRMFALSSAPAPSRLYPAHRIACHSSSTRLHCCHSHLHASRWFAYLAQDLFRWFLLPVAGSLPFRFIVFYGRYLVHFVICHAMNATRATPLLSPYVVWFGVGFYACSVPYLSSNAFRDIPCSHLHDCPALPTTLPHLCVCPVFLGLCWVLLILLEVFGWVACVHCLPV